MYCKSKGCFTATVAGASMLFTGVASEAMPLLPVDGAASPLIRVQSAPTAVTVAPHSGTYSGGAPSATHSGAPRAVRGYGYGYGGGWHHRGWRGYHHHGDYYDHDDGAAVAAGILGFALGAMAASQARHYRGGSCAQRFRSYDPASGTYLGYDGRRHPCP